MEDTYGPTKYSFMIMLQCTTEEEVATSMEKLMRPIVGLCLEGINVHLMRMPEEEAPSGDRTDE